MGYMAARSLLFIFGEAGPNAWQNEVPCSLAARRGGQRPLRGPLTKKRVKTHKRKIYLARSVSGGGVHPKNAGFARSRESGGNSSDFPILMVAIGK